MRIIFLDVDGVLNSNPYLESINKSLLFSSEMLERLSEIYHAYDDVKIVLSSTWKEINPTDLQYQALVGSLKLYDMEIIDHTPDYDEFGELLITRPFEIEQWLKNHKEIKKWVSIEDDCSFEEYEKVSKEFANHLVHTFYWGKSIEETGLTDKHVKKAIEILL